MKPEAKTAARAGLASDDQRLDLKGGIDIWNSKKNQLIFRSVCHGYLS